MNNKDDCSEWVDFVERHPLRFLCYTLPVKDFVNRAQTLVVEILSRLEKEKISLPLNSSSLEKQLAGRSIRICEDHDAGWTNSSHHSYFISWYDPDEKMIHIGVKSPGDFTVAGREKSTINAPTGDEIRALLLAHEWFHVLVCEVPMSSGYEALPVSQKVIIEEIAARIFSVRITGGKYLATYLDRFFQDVRNARGGE